MAAVDLVEHVFLDQMRAPRHVDHIGARLQLRQRLRVDDVARVGGEHQQVDQHTRRGQKISEPCLAAEAAHTIDLLGRTAPACHRKIELCHRACHAFAQRAQPHHAHRKLRARARAAHLPLARALLVRIGVEFTKVPDQRVAHILGHLHRHAAIVDAHQRHRARPWQLDQRIHARAQIEHALQALLLLHKLHRRLPHHGIVGPRRTRPPFGDLGAGHCALQAVDPLIDGRILEIERDPHGLRD
ncbi:hypothetical protein SDC9_90933 [bioreactor metagenome]|uniref:Uncharacterized protein n=1 Tax=bioreactor metagenome TaxID=1076179 RepID=A0A644ZTP2_9ZZZZ